MRKPINYPTSTHLEREYLRKIEILEKKLEERSDNAWIQNQNVIDLYAKVFNWLDQQKWYQLHEYKVKNYVDSLIEIKHLHNQKKDV